MGHGIAKGERYIVGNYLEKDGDLSTKTRKVQFKMTKKFDQIFIHINEVFAFCIEKVKVKNIKNYVGNPNKWIN